MAVISTRHLENGKVATDQRVIWDSVHAAKRDVCTRKDCVCGSKHSRKETLHDTMSIFKVKGRKNFRATKIARILCVMPCADY